jgi:hypothetical protein
MSQRYKKDHIALQALWFDCVIRYNRILDEGIRLKIVDDFRDNLVDIKPNNPGDKKNLREIYLNWEQNTWIPECKKELDNWIKANSFEAGDRNNLLKQYEFIKRYNNHKRFSKIIQVIQDSGIGLGTGETTGKGHYVGPENLEEFI